jgi:hypothetical protein
MANPNLQMSAYNCIRQLCGPNNQFIAEGTLLNQLKAQTMCPNINMLKSVLAQLVKANMVDCYVPLTQAGCGPDCGCGSCCAGGCCGGCGSCGSCCACGGCGRYYRVKIG